MNFAPGNGSNPPKHVRKNTGTSGIFAAAMESNDEPTLTTKALMVSVTAPRIFITSNAKTGAELELETVATNLSIDAPIDKTAAEIAISVATVPSVDDEDHGTVEPKAVASEEGTEKTKSAESQSDSDGILPEEAAAVAAGDDPDQANINVEELLRIAFQNLLEEWHLLNVPTYTLLLDKQMGPLANMEPIDDHAQTSWIQVNVMARPASLGIILERLERIGIGTDIGTLTIFKSELCRTASAYAHRPVVIVQEPPPSEDESLVDSNSNADDAKDKPAPESEEDAEAERAAAEAAAEQERLKTERAIKAARAEWKNAATRLRIEQVREQIVEQASLTFDYIALLIVASILAGVGLITDNTVVIVASMLVSPIMGPVLGCVFGLRIKDWSLVRGSFLNETLSLLTCVLIGVFVGLGASFTPLAEQTWPTNEMSIRGEATGLLTGIAVAIPSGMGVCLSILGGNTSSLVGVAISASLLPPAVNAGICFVHAIFLEAGLLETDSATNANDFARIGAISFALTVLNIVCIWLSGIVMFEIKEVAPAEQKNAFWARDIKAARTAKPVDGKVLRQGLGRALAKREKSDRNIPVVKIRPPKPHTPNATVNTLFPLQPNSRPNQYPVWSTSWNDTVHGVEDDDDVRYVGLEDMGRLLGFDDDDDDEEEEEPEIDSQRSEGRFGWNKFLFGS